MTASEAILAELIATSPDLDRHAAAFALKSAGMELPATTNNRMADIMFLRAARSYRSLLRPVTQSNSPRHDAERAALRRCQSAVLRLALAAVQR